MRKKTYLILATMMIGAMLAGCDKSGDIDGLVKVDTQEEMQEETQAEDKDEEISEEQTAQQTEEGTEEQITILTTPEVKDGVMLKGEDAVETHFEWNSVEGATGYEVAAESKFYEDKDYSEYGTVETTDTS